MDGAEKTNPDPSLKGSGIEITDSRRHHPRGRQTAKSSGRSPGLGFLLGPAFPLAQWHDGPSSPDTVAGQRRNLTDFPNTGCGLDYYSRPRRQSIGANVFSAGEVANGGRGQPWRRSRFGVGLSAPGKSVTLLRNANTDANHRRIAQRQEHACDYARDRRPDRYAPLLHRDCRGARRRNARAHRASSDDPPVRVHYGRGAR